MSTPPTGRYSTPVTGLSPDDMVVRPAVETGFSMVTGLRANATNRANFGCSNADVVPVTVRAEIYTSSTPNLGSPAAVEEFSLAAGGWGQKAVPVQDELIRILYSVSSGGGDLGVYCYGVNVNNASNDGTSIPAIYAPWFRRASAVRLAPTKHRQNAATRGAADEARRQPVERAGEPLGCACPSPLRRPSGSRGGPSPCLSPSTGGESAVRVPVLVEVEGLPAARVFGTVLRGKAGSGGSSRAEAATAARAQVARNRASQAAARAAARRTLRGDGALSRHEGAECHRGPGQTGRRWPRSPDSPECVQPGCYGWSSRSNATSVPFIGAPPVWDGSSGLGSHLTGAGVTIGIIDSGVDYIHSDFGGTGTWRTTRRTTRRLPRLPSTRARRWSAASISPGTPTTEATCRFRTRTRWTVSGTGPTWRARPQATA